MTKVIRLKESDIQRMVKRVLTEQSLEGEWKPDPNDRSSEINTKTGEKRSVFKKGKVPQYSEEDLKRMEEIRAERKTINMFSDADKDNELTDELRAIQAKYK